MDRHCRSWLSFDATTQTFSGTPPLNYTGDLDLKVIASDGALIVSDTFTLTVMPVNDAPVVSAPILDQVVSPGSELVVPGSDGRILRCGP